MPHVAIILSSIRKGRNSNRIALYLKKYLEENNLSSAEILDLLEYKFPLFEERLKFLPSPTSAVLDFVRKIIAADGIIIVTPEYNGSYPASLKNIIDLLYDEWYRKPVAISTVSDGPFGGTQVITSLQFSLWKMHAWTVPAMFPVAHVQESFDVNGNPQDRTATDKRARRFVKELLWCVEAKNRMI
jgi:NAD(P)H-dependent FMN reductase